MLHKVLEVCTDYREDPVPLTTGLAAAQGLVTMATDTAKKAKTTHKKHDQKTKTGPHTPHNHANTHTFNT